jgi:hypothetical protein
MTDLLEPYVAPPMDDLPPDPTITDDGDSHELAPFLRYLLAACLFGAAAIHLAMVPGHMAEWAAEGIAFVVTAWIQIGLGVAVLLRPRRWMLWAALLTSAVFVGAWAWSRLWGPPFGPNSGLKEAATFIDVSCVALEGVAVLVAALAIWRPRLSADWSHSAMVMASVVPVAALVVGSVAVASPSASQHNHGAGEAADGHTHTAPDKLGFSLLGNGHHHAIAPHDQDPATQAELDRQIAITREVAATYPTVASAEAAGYKRAGPYSPGLGAHYTKVGPNELNADGVVDDEDLRHPLSIIYDGNDPDSKVAGFMYYSMSTTEPVGFVGTNDTWHTHSNVCVKFGPDGVDSPLGADLPITKEQCEATGAVLLDSTQWMVHVWSVPGYDNTNGGVFAEENPALACSDGTYFMLPPEEWPTNLMNVCRSKAPGVPKENIF